MKLGTKLFLSYLAVLVITMFVLSASMTVLAPARFDRRLRPIVAPEDASQGEDAQTQAGEQPTILGSDLGTGQGQGGGPGQGQGQGRGQGPPPVSNSEVMFQQIQEGFRSALNNALLFAGLAALAAATLASWLITSRIVRPLEQLAGASHRIAAGHYDERLEVFDDGDELGELANSFNLMAGALEETETMRQQLIADVSHELKTPLASIKGYMEGLQDGIISASPETYDLIHREATRLQRLVERMQQLSRAEADQLNLEIKPEDAGTLIASAADWLRPQFEHKGVSLRVDAPPEHLSVQADFDQTRQVLLNLLGNALQYTPPGGSVTVATQANGAQKANFIVQDTGIGLSAQDRDRIFQRFYRVDKSRARTSGGSGIGLTIARHIVEAHGGEIWATSDGPNQGSTFVFTLPRTA